MSRLHIDFAVQDRGLVLGTEFWIAVLLQLVAGVYLLGVGLGANAKDIILPPPTSRKDAISDVNPKNYWSDRLSDFGSVDDA